jgi:hypothetical protein
MLSSYLWRMDPAGLRSESREMMCCDILHTRMCCCRAAMLRSTRSTSSSTCFFDIYTHFYERVDMPADPAAGIIVVMIDVSVITIKEQEKCQEYYLRIEILSQRLPDFGRE